MHRVWIILAVLVVNSVIDAKKRHRRFFQENDSDRELRRTKRTIYQALLKRVDKRDNQYTNLESKPKTTRKPYIPRQSKEIYIEVKFIHPWRDEMGNKASPEYKLLAGNIADALRNELSADLNYITSGVKSLKKTDQGDRIFADIGLRFYKTEVNPVRHLQGIVNRGWISGEQVDPTYFKRLDKDPAKSPKIPEWAYPIETDLHPIPAMKDEKAGKEKEEVLEFNEKEKLNNTKVQYKLITITIKLKQLYNAYLADKNSPEYKELSGNVDQALLKIFVHDIFFLEGHVITFSESPEGRIFCTMSIQFRREEKFAIEKCQAAIATGDFAGMPIDDQYFRVDTLGETDENGKNFHPILSTPSDKMPKPTANRHKLRALPLHYIEMRFSIKLNNSWMSTLSDNTTKAYQLFSGIVEQAMDRGLFEDLDYIDSNVLEFLESPEHTVITNIATRFQLNETDPELTVRSLIKNGTLSGIPLDCNFFFVFSISYRIKPPLPPANGVPQAVDNNQNNTAQQQGQKQQAESNWQIQSQPQPQQQNYQQNQLPYTTYTSTPSDVSPTINPYLPKQANDASPPRVKYLNSAQGVLQSGYPGSSYPFPQSSQQSWYPTPPIHQQSTESTKTHEYNPYLPVETISTDTLVTTATPYMKAEKPLNVDLNTIEGTVTLQEKWSPYLSDVKSQDYKNLESTIINAIRGIYQRLDVDVAPEVVGFSETAVPTTSETKVSVRFKIVSFKQVIDTKPLEDAGKINSINGIPIYENTLVLAGTVNPVTGHPSTTPSLTLCQQQRKSSEEMSNSGQIGSFVPQCSPDGQYKPVQCHALTGFCWCVNNAGVRLQGTEIRYQQPNCEGTRILGNVYLPLNTTSDLPPGSCLTVSVQEMLLCGKDVNCHIPVTANQTFRNVSLIKNAIPYELVAPKMKVGRYVVSAVVNMGWCRINSLKTQHLIHTGDYHSTEMYTIDIQPDTETIGQDLYVEPVTEEETGIRLHGTVNLPKDLDTAVFTDESCLSIETKELNPCVGARCGALPSTSNSTIRPIQVFENTIPYDVQLTNLNPGTYVISVVIHTVRCPIDREEMEDGDFYNEDMQEFVIEEYTNDIEKDVDVVELTNPSGGSTVSGRVHFPSEVTTIKGGSCLTVSSRKLIKCKNNNCKIPPVASRTFENIEYQANGVPYSLSLPINSPGSYLISAVINNGWCKLHSEGIWIKTGDFYNDRIQDFEVKNESEAIGKNIDTAVYWPKNELERELTINGRVYLPKTGNIPFMSPRSCLVIKVQEETSAPCTGENCIIPLTAKQVFRSIHLEGNSLPYVIALRNVTKRKSYLISAVLNVDWCQEDNPFSTNYLRDGDFHNIEQEVFIVPESEKEIEHNFRLFRYSEELITGDQIDDNDKVQVPNPVENNQPESSSSPVTTPLTETAGFNNTTTPALETTTNSQPTPSMLETEDVPTSGKTNTTLHNTQTSLETGTTVSNKPTSLSSESIQQQTAAGQQKQQAANYKSTNFDIAASKPSSTEKTHSAKQQPEIANLLNATKPIISTYLPIPSNKSLFNESIQTNENGIDSNQPSEIYSSTKTLTPSANDTLELTDTTSGSPPATTSLPTIYSPLVTLPKGLPKSCEEIRNAGIGKMDGQYIIEAREGCHISIICQDMEGNPKEFLGGPSEDEWKYWHFAVLIKISDQDKQNIPQGACLEHSDKGRDLLQRILIAGAKQGNPIEEWKTNIAKLLRTRRNIPPNTSLITKAKTIFKDKQEDQSEWGVL